MGLGFQGLEWFGDLSNRRCFDASLLRCRRVSNLLLAVVFQANHESTNIPSKTRFP